VTRLNRIPLLLLVGLLPSLAFAWNHDGHTLVGAIADQLLSPSAQAHVQQLVGMPLRDAARWADCAKSVDDHTFTFNPTDPFNQKACAVFATPEGIVRMVDYVRRNATPCHPQPGEEICHKQYHYADVAYQHDHYDRWYRGTSDHDIVSALDAAIAKLKGQPVPAPFDLKDGAEALFLLAHLVGDLHQPLHIGAVYLDDTDIPEDPDTPACQGMPVGETYGGNAILDPASCSTATGRCTNLHAEWDTPPAPLTVGDESGELSADLMDAAKRVPATPGPIETWPAKWASESVVVSHVAYRGLTYRPAPGDPHRWIAQFPDPAKYERDKARLQRDQLINAGARLAAILNALWP
jgi:S1/P1 Nuclease